MPTAHWLFGSQSSGGLLELGTRDHREPHTTYQAIHSCHTLTRNCERSGLIADPQKGLTRRLGALGFILAPLVQRPQCWIRRCLAEFRGLPGWLNRRCSFIVRLGSSRFWYCPLVYISKPQQEALLLVVWNSLSEWKTFAFHHLRHFTNSCSNLLKIDPSN